MQQVVMFPLIKAPREMQQVVMFDLLVLISCLGKLKLAGLLCSASSMSGHYVGARRLRHSRSVPSVRTQRTLRGANEATPVQRLRPTVLHAAVWALGYIILASVAFYFLGLDSQVKTDRFLDAVYFVVVTTTTVGYGDILPRSDAAKLLACISVLVGMGIVALFVSRMITYLVDKHQTGFSNALCMHSRLSVLMRFRKIGIRRAKWNCLFAC